MSHPVPRALFRATRRVADCAALLAALAGPAAAQSEAATQPVQASTQPAQASTLRQDLSFRPSYLREPVRVLIVGTWHFANPGRDLVNPQSDDMRSPERRAELEALLEDLAAFEPTHVAIERPLANDSAVQARYRALRAGAEPGASEAELIGMQLALRMRHERVHPVDFQQDLDLDALIRRATQSDREVAARMEPVLGHVGEMLTGLIRGRTLSGALLALNDPELGDVGHGVYLELAAAADGADYPGADVIDDWYARNLRIFTNIAHIARPGDRIVVVFGSGHEPLLRHYVEMTPGFEVVPLAQVLTP